MNGFAFRFYLGADRSAEIKLAGKLVFSGLAAFAMAGPARAQLAYTTLDFGTNSTFLTGIRGNNIVGNYVVPGTTSTGGLLYDQSTGVFTALPVATASGVNYPGATVSSPYGPSFGSQYGILRTVGSYQTAASAPYNLSYLYDGAGGTAGTLTTLVYPSAPGAATLETIAHSTFGDQVVGNYDTRLATGNAFIYTISSGTYVTNNMPGALSTTAYGVFGDKIAGGYTPLGVGGGPGLDRGYIYDETTGRFTSYNYPGAVFTHFEGITGGGASGTYNLVADWAGTDAVLHAAVLHIDALGRETWIDIAVPGASTTSANSIYGNEAIGVYTDSTGVHGYTVSIPGIYNPITNSGALTTTVANVNALSGTPGDDILNTGTITTNGTNSIGIHSDSYGFVTNTGTILARGLTGAGVDLNGSYGTLLNSGTITAVLGADAIRTGPTAIGTTIINTGIIDGRVIVSAGNQVRFENSGFFGISSAGAGVPHVISGTFVQTAAGTLSLRIAPTVNDILQVNGTVRLAGNETSVFQSQSGLLRSYQIVTAVGGVTGTFDTSTAIGLPNFMTTSLTYAPNSVTLNVISDIAQSPGLTRNQAAVGSGLDKSFNATGALPPGLEVLYNLSPGELPSALNQLSGEAHASQKTALIDQAVFVRQAVLGRLRQISYMGESGSEAALGNASAFVASYDDTNRAALSALSYAGDSLPAGPQFPIKGPPPAPHTQPGVSFWAQGFGGWGNISGNGNASGVNGTFAGGLSGADFGLADNWRAGMALGYAQSNTSFGALASSSVVNTGLISGYAATSYGAWKLRFAAVYGFNAIETNRNIAIPGFGGQDRANYNAGTAQLISEVGYGMAWQAIGIEPFAGLTFVRLDTTGFTESGAASLNSSGSGENVGYSTLGLRLATNTPLWNGMVLTPRLSAGWQYAFGTVNPTTSLAFTSVSGTNFNVTGAPLARNAALLDVGADLRIAPQIKIGISYTGQLADRVHDNALKGDLLWVF